MPEIKAKVPIVVSGYGFPTKMGDDSPTIRQYYILDCCIAEATVMRYEDAPGRGVVGFLLNGKLYQELGVLDEAVGQIAVSRLLEAWSK